MDVQSLGGVKTARRFGFRHVSNGQVILFVSTVHLQSPNPCIRYQNLVCSKDKI